jgi:hypothetical protein
MVAAEGPVINADNAERIGSHAASPSHHPQQSIIADRHHQPLGNACGRPAAERQPQVVNDTFQTRGPAGSLRDNPVIKPFGKYPSSTERCTTDEASRGQSKLNLLARTRQPETVLTYWLLTRLDDFPHSGQTRSLTPARAGRS